LRRTAQKLRLGTTPLLLPSFEQVEANLSKAYLDFKRIKKDEKRRNTWLDGLAAARAAAGKRSKATELAQLQRHEEQRRLARQIKQANGKLRASGGLATVMAPSPTDPDTWTEISTKQAMEKACLEEAERRFTQASSTPFLTPPLYDIFGKLGCHTRAFQEIAEGTFQVPPGTDPYVQNSFLTLRGQIQFQTSLQSSRRMIMSRGGKKPRNELLPVHPDYTSDTT
jgi:hypothetical protein